MKLPGKEAPELAKGEICMLVGDTDAEKSFPFLTKRHRAGNQANKQELPFHGHVVLVRLSRVDLAVSF